MNVLKILKGVGKVLAIIAQVLGIVDQAVNTTSPAPVSGLDPVKPAQPPVDKQPEKGGE